MVYTSDLGYSNSTAYAMDDFVLCFMCLFPVLQILTLKRLFYKPVKIIFQISKQKLYDVNC
jgi:hypothetical protein